MTSKKGVPSNENILNRTGDKNYCLIIHDAISIPVDDLSLTVNAKLRKWEILWPLQSRELWLVDFKMKFSRKFLLDARGQTVHKQAHNFEFLFSQNFNSINIPKFYENYLNEIFFLLQLPYFIKWKWDFVGSRLFCNLNLLLIFAVLKTPNRVQMSKTIPRTCADGNEKLFQARNDSTIKQTQRV